MPAHSHLIGCRGSFKLWHNRKRYLKTGNDRKKKKKYGNYSPTSESTRLGSRIRLRAEGVEHKNNIKKYWWDSMVLLHENVVGIDSAIFMHPTIWKASGHVDAFNDPLIDNKDSKKRYRADVLIEDHLAKLDDKMEKEVQKVSKRFGESTMP